MGMKKRRERTRVHENKVIHYCATTHTHKRAAMSHTNILDSDMTCTVDLVLVFCAINSQWDQSASLHEA